MIHCLRCGRPSPQPSPSEPPSCPVHGTVWEAVRNAPCAAVIVAGPGGRVVLGQRGIEPWSGYWEIPGGFCDAGEHPADTAVREAREELGLGVRLVSLLGVYLHDVIDPADRVWRHVVVYTGTTEDEPVVDGHEVLDAAWFDLGQLPDRVVPGHLDRLADLRHGTAALEVGRR